MEFLLGLIVVIGLTYLLMRYFAPRILQWMVKRYIQQADPHTKSRQASRKGWHSAASQQSSADAQSQQGKLDMKDIAKKKFEKDQGEYIDFEEE
ncbi:MAG: DUF4834 family protein [Porphyromonas asaccharolytica]